MRRSVLILVLVLGAVARAQEYFADEDSDADYDAMLAKEPKLAPRVFGSEMGCIEAAPGPVTKLKAYGARTSITVAWRAPTGNACVDTFDYTVKEVGLPAKRSAGAPQQSQSYSITVNDLKPDTEYVVTINAVNSVKGSGRPATINVRTKALPACDAKKPAAVTDFFVDQLIGQVQLSWLPAEVGGCATSYSVVGLDPAGRRVFSTETLEPEALATGLLSETKYTFTVTPLNKAGAGPASSVGTVIKATCRTKGYPGPVRDLTWVSLPLNRVKLTWKYPNKGVCVANYYVHKPGQAKRKWAEEKALAPDADGSYIYQLSRGERATLKVRALSTNNKRSIAKTVVVYAGGSGVATGR